MGLLDFRTLGGFVDFGTLGSLNFGTFRILKFGNLGLRDLGTFGLFYFLTLGLWGTSRPFDFWTWGLYDCPTSGFLDCLICRLRDFVDFPTLGLWGFGTFPLWDLGLWDFGTFFDFSTFGLGIFDFST